SCIRSLELTIIGAGCMMKSWSPERSIARSDTSPMDYTLKERLARFFQVLCLIGANILAGGMLLISPVVAFVLAQPPPAGGHNHSLGDKILGLVPFLAVFLFSALAIALNQWAER